MSSSNNIPEPSTIPEPISPQHSASSFGSSSNRRSGRARSVDDPNNADNTKLWHKLVELMSQINVLRLQITWGSSNIDTKLLEDQEKKCISDLLHAIEGMSWQGGINKRVGRVDDGDQSHSVSQTHTLLTAACYYGNLEAVKKILGLNSKLLEEPTEFGWTPIVCAGNQGWDIVVEYLLEKGADALMQTDNGDNILTHVVRAENKPPSWINQNHRDLIEKALTDRKEGKLSIFKQLIRSKFYVDLVNDSNNLGQTPLMIACQSGNDKLVEMMVMSAEVNVNSQDGSGKTALMYAVTAPNKRRALIRALFQNIQLEINIRTVIETEQTAITYAALQGNVDALEELLAQAGAKNRRLDLWLTKMGDNVHLVDAIDEIGFSRCLRVLVKAAANGQVSLRDFNSNGQKATPLIIACKNAWAEEVPQLLRITDLDPNEFDRTGYTALMHACSQSGDAYRTITRTLLHSGRISVNLVSQEDHWTTALGVAVLQNNVEAVEELVIFSKQSNDTTLDLTIFGEDGPQSVLTNAVNNKQVEIIQILIDGLLEGGLKPEDFRYFFNIYPELASDRIYKRALDLLIEHEGDVLFRDTSDSQHFVVKSVPLTRTCSRYLQELMWKINGEAAFQGASIQGLIRYWWDLYGMTSFSIKFLIFALFFIVNILHMALYLEGYTESEEKGALWIAFALAFIILGIKLLSVSYYDLVDGWSEWFSKFSGGDISTRAATFTEIVNYFVDFRFWINALDLALIVLALALPVLEEGKNFEHTLAAQCLLLFFRLLLWLLPLENVGQQLQVVSMVFRQSLIYIATIVIFLLGFALAFSLLSIGTNDSFIDYSHSFLFTALGFFGGTSLELHETYETRTGFPYNAVFGLMTILYFVVIPVIFISLLVAFLTSSWQDLIRRQNAYFWRSRALSLISTMNLMKNLNFLMHAFGRGGFGKQGDGRKEGVMNVEVRFVNRGEGDLKSQQLKVIADVNHMKEAVDTLTMKSSQSDDREVELSGRIEELMGKLEQLSSFWDGYKMGRKYAEMSQSQMS